MSSHPVRSVFTRIASLGALVFAAAILSNCGNQPVTPTPVTTTTGATVYLTGSVQGGQQPISGASIQLYAAGTTAGADGQAATALLTGASVLSGSDGTFSVTSSYTCPSATTQVYLVASGGNPGLSSGTSNNSVLTTALGNCSSLNPTTPIWVNEVTTAASTAALAPFMTSFTSVGSTAADAQAMLDDFSLVKALVDTTKGTSPGAATVAGVTVDPTKVYALADASAPCVNSLGKATAGDGSACGNLFLYATPASGKAPTNVADALLNVAANPTLNVAQIFGLIASSPPFTPRLAAAPADWSLVPPATISLQPGATTLGLGATVTGTLTLGRAPLSDTTVTLTSSNPSSITVTSPVTTSAGKTSATFTYTGVAAGPSALTASAPGYAPVTTQLTAINQTITLGTVPTVAPGSSTSLPVSLSAVAPTGGVTITLASSNTAAATISPSTITIAAGQMAPVTNPTVTGVGSGTANITANAVGYVQTGIQVTVSTQTIALGTVATLSPGSSTSLPISLSGSAPAGGVTITLASSNTSIATISPSTITIPAGQKVPATNPTVTGVGLGIASITATAAGYVPTNAQVPVLLTAALDSASRSIIAATVNSTLTVSSPAPAGGITFTVTSSNTAAVTVPATVTMPAGATTVLIPITGVTDGTAAVTISSPVTNTVAQAVTVNTSILVHGNVQLVSGTELAGVNLTTSVSVGLGLAPPVGVNLTVTSSNPALAVLSSSASVMGSSTVTLNGVADTNTRYVYVQGLAAGSAVLTISAPGYTTTTYPVTVYPSGFVMYTPYGANPSSYSVYSAALVPGGYFQLPLIPGVSATVALANSAPTVVSVPASVMIGSGMAAATFTFKALSNGSATITAVAPAGYVTPSAYNSVVITINSFQVVNSAATLSTGVNLTNSGTVSATICAIRCGPEVAITSSNPAIALLSASLSQPGTSAIGLDLSSGSATYYVQGLSPGTTTLTFDAGSPYIPSQTVVTVFPTGFGFSGGNVTTKSSSSASIPISAYYLDNSGNIQGALPVNVGVSLAIPVSSSNTAVGTVPSTVTIPAGSSTGASTSRPWGLERPR